MHAHPEQQYVTQGQPARQLGGLQDCSDEERQSLGCCLLTRNLPGLRSLAKQLSIKLSGVSITAVIERIICMAEFCCIRHPDKPRTP